MKKLFWAVLTVVFISGDIATATGRYTSEQISNYVRQTPRSLENNIAPLVRYLVKPFDNDYDKAKAIAYWIGSHIYYDDFLYSGTKNKDTYLRNSYRPQSAAKLLRSRAGICVDYANLFLEMCSKAGITTRIVRGYAYPTGMAFSPAVRKNYAHVWNYFYYRGSKIYVDPTFMAGGILGADEYPNSAKHNRALYKFRKKNRDASMQADVNDYYFDFTYRDEKQTQGRIRKER